VPGSVYFFLGNNVWKNKKSPRIITEMNDKTSCIANLHSLKYKPLSLISRVYISLEMDHKNLEALGFSRRHHNEIQRLLFPLKASISSPELWHFLALHNDIGMKGRPLSPLSLKCALNGYQGSLGGL
jgi:hypothetical protein